MKYNIYNVTLTNNRGEQKNIERIRGKGPKEAVERYVCFLAGCIVKVKLEAVEPGLVDNTKYADNELFARASLTTGDRVTRNYYKVITNVEW